MLFLKCIALHWGEKTYGVDYLENKGDFVGPIRVCLLHHWQILINVSYGLRRPAIPVDEAYDRDCKQY